MNEQGMNQFLETLRQAFIVIMRQIDLDKSQLVKNSNFLWRDNAVQISMEDYAIYVDSGRRVGTMPPVRAISQWIRTSGISIPIGMKAEQFAFAIARSIQKKGIKARPFLDRLSKEVTQLTFEYMNHKVQEELLMMFKDK